MSGTADERTKVELPFIAQLHGLGWQHIEGDTEVPTDGVRRINLEDGQHPAAKLTEADVRRIRELVAAGQTGKDVAALYGSSPSLVSLIVRRKKWAHVP